MNPVNMDDPTTYLPTVFELNIRQQPWGSLRLELQAARLVTNLTDHVADLSDADLERCVALGDAAREENTRRMVARNLALQSKRVASSDDAGKVTA